LLTLSAKSQAALRELAQRYARHLSDAAQLSLGDLCFTANHGRAHFQHRFALVLDSQSQAGTCLAGFADGKDNSRIVTGQARESGKKIVFLFTGQGSQYVGMGRELYETQPTFRAVIDRCDVVAQTSLGRSLIELIYPVTQPTHNDLMDSHPCGQAANFALECALADLWRSWGVQPNLVLGHSLGDFAAAYTAGVFSLEDGMRLVIERGRLMEQAQGSMVSVIGSETEVQPFIAPFADVTVGVINGPRSVVISGGHANVARVVEQLQQAGLKTHKLDIPVAAHSPLLDAVLDEFESAVRRVKLSAPRCQVISSMTGQRVTSELSEPRYWRQHLRNTVRFADGVQTLHEQGARIFLEIGPKPTLVGMAETILDSETSGKQSGIEKPESRMDFLPSLRAGRSDWQQMLTSLGKLYVRGIEIDWVGFDKDKPRHMVTLPTYPFQRKRYWITDKKFQKRNDVLRPVLRNEGNEEEEKMNTQSPGQPQPFDGAAGPEERRTRGGASIDLATLLAQLQQAIQANPDGVDLQIDEIRGLHIRFNPGTGATLAGEPAQSQPVGKASSSPSPKRRLTPLATANATPPRTVPTDTTSALTPSLARENSVEGTTQRDDKTQNIAKHPVGIDSANLTLTLKQLLADLLYFEDVAAIDESAKFIDLGMDSVTGVEFINMINRGFALKLKAVVLYDYSSIRELATLLLPLLQTPT
ncbi:MAG: acyltransferase domain-containing protein, partial [Chloroflexota bacterium]|nr:acyltransferase domain-containing protein [Chloroflexota bacterium]